MKATVFFAVISGAAALSAQEVVDDFFDKEVQEVVPPEVVLSLRGSSGVGPGGAPAPAALPVQKATWEEVKACRGKCDKDSVCIEACPKFQSPFQRIVSQCNVFNSYSQMPRRARIGADTIVLAFARPTTIKELEMTGQAMVCHMKCGHDNKCQKACFNPWAEKRAQCANLHAIVMCHQEGGSHSSCPHLDAKIKTELMQEPWGLVKDIGNHVVDYLLPLLGSQEVSVEAVRACHMRCGDDLPCHKRCPKGVFGRFQDKCNTLEQASVCHKTCEDSENNGPFNKMECHHECPMSMPTSVRELKGLMDHVLCHSTCGEDQVCHEACPNSNWGEKMSQCKQYDEMLACHKQCALDGTCHASCPWLSDQTLNDIKRKPTNIVKGVLDVLVV